MAAFSNLHKCVVSQTGKHTATVIFLHGSGDSGQGIRTWVRDVLKQDLAFQHIRVIYPTAPLRPYTPMKGAQSNVWFDRYKISNDCPEHLESIDSMCKVLGDLVDVEVKAGVSKNRILVGKVF
ncbi:lysophospholipase-like protein 1 [Huso huso]|uniref:palmitoyl-protein hydrolase n=1 Tax=Huso huso TaxID=61971 RepID=A0ABR0Y0Z2_HUSHU